jgi:hypothetical protein
MVTKQDAKGYTEVETLYFYEKISEDEQKKIDEQK